MKDTALRLAMREMQRVFSRPGPWIIIAAVIAALGISGPFGTIHSLGFLTRLAYWAVVVVLTLGAGWLVSQWSVFALARHGASRIVQWLGGSLAVSLVTMLIVGVLNVLAFGESLADPSAWLRLTYSTVPIALLVTAAFTWGARGSQGAETARAPQPPRLLGRLPLDKRGALISLSVQDHYVEVVTTRGRELLLMRLSDAVVEAEGCAGLQVHRSHWVALNQVQAARRDGARGVLTLSDGREIPVSRTYVPAAKEAGLF